MHIKNIQKTFATVIFSSLCFGANAQSDPISDFYNDRTLTIISPSGTGGSIYLYNLLVSNHIGRHLPGNPDAVVEARVGGGGITAANYVDAIGPQDGTIVAGLHPSALLAPRFEKTASSAKYDPAEFQWLGTLVARTYVDAIWHTVPVESLEDTLETEITMGATGRGAVTYQNPRFMAHVTKAQYNIAPGYASGGELNLAMERGEIDGRGNYYSGFLATNPDWVEDGKLKFLYTMGPSHPDLVDVPAARDIVAGEDNLAMLTMLEAPINIGQAFYVSKDVPKERVAALREAFNRMIEDEAFLEDAAGMNLVLDPKPVDYIQEIADDVLALPDDVARNLDAIISQ